MITAVYRTINHCKSMLAPMDYMQAIVHLHQQHTTRGLHHNILASNLNTYPTIVCIDKSSSLSVRVQPKLRAITHDVMLTELTMPTYIHSNHSAVTHGS